MGTVTNAAEASVVRRNDLDLAGRCTSGEREAQRALLHAHRQRVHAILYRVVGSNHAIDDLVQESFLEIFRSLGTYRGDSSLGTWIDRITTRVAQRYLGRPRARLVQLEAVPEPSVESGSAEEAMMLRDAARRLYAALDDVAPACRVAFVLHVIDGRSVNEVAALTESSTLAVKTRVWRARRHVRDVARTDPVLRALLEGTGFARKRGRDAR